MSPLLSMSNTAIYQAHSKFYMSTDGAGGAAGRICLLKSNQGNQDSSGNQKNAIQGQRPDMIWKTDTYDEEHKTTKTIHIVVIHKVTKVNKQLGLH